MALKFFNLHGHDNASIFDGIGRPEDYVRQVLENAGEDSGGFALTNHGNLNSVGFISAANKKTKKNGRPVKILYGLEAYYLPSLNDWQALKNKEATQEDETQDLVVEDESESKSNKWLNPINRRNHLVLVAISNEGLKNLFRLTTFSYTKGFYRKPRIDLEMLREHNEGLIMSTACIAGIGGHVSRFNMDTDIDEVMKLYEKEVLPIFEIFGNERAYCELQFNKLEEQRALNLHMIEFGKRFGYKSIVTCDSHYPAAEDWRAREIYRLLGYQQMNKQIDKSIVDKQVDELECSLYLKNGDQLFEEYKKTFKDSFDDDQYIIDAIQRTYEIGHELADWVVPDSTPKFPKKLIGNIVKTDFDVLKEKSWTALKEKGLNEHNEYVERLIEELEQIQDRKVSAYFLAVVEIIQTLRKYMLIGPARGSSAGSLVCYLLGITQLDPLRHGLLWERFYGKGRSDLPDIDIDFSDKEQALEILKEKFGEENVITISNYNGLNLKSLTKDICRLYDIPFEEVNEVTKKVEDEAKDKILESINYDQKLYELNFENAYEFSQTYREFIDKYPEISEHIQALLKETKSIGTHAAGVLILDEAASCLPVIKIRNALQSPITEGISAQHLQDFGLIKFDILGLTTLKTIRRCIELILIQDKQEPTMENVWRWYDENLHPDILDPEDEKIFNKVYKGGKFCSIFQFTKDKVKDFSKEAKLESLEEISQVTSIQRPGPLSAKVDRQYLDIKMGYAGERNEHPIVEKILGPTHFLLIFQEQFMMLAHELAGFSLEETNQLRKILMKPSKELKGQLLEDRQKARDKFIDGCVNNGLSRERAVYLWDVEISGFVSYSFNKSHSHSYAYVSYQCAYLLTYFERDWIRACLETDPDIEMVSSDITSMGYEIGKPDILFSESESWFITKQKQCIPSLRTLKGFGEAAANELMEMRDSWIKPDEDSFGIEYFKAIFDSFFYNLVEVETKRGTKIKKKWKFSKFNKRALEALIKCEALESLNIVGEGRLFENYAHMYRVLIENWSKKEQVKFNIATLAIETPNQDWEDSEKVNYQFDILGSYDKNLILTEEDLEELESVGIFPLEKLSDSPNHHWFILDDFIIKSTKNGKKYHRLFISDTVGNKKVLNYFLPIYLPLKRKSVYAATLQMNGAWLNLAKGGYIIKVK